MAFVIRLQATVALLERATDWRANRVLQWYVAITVCYSGRRLPSLNMEQYSTNELTLMDRDVRLQSQRARKLVELLLGDECP